jgi:DNA mismatch endonuclease (patch repair protein)
MSRIHGKNTGPELALRKSLWAAGVRGYRANWGRPSADIAFTRWMLAVFVDGCFWHGCPEHYREPKTNRMYWVPKIARNAARDGESTIIWKSRGWAVLRLWGHVPTGEMAGIVIDALNKRKKTIIDQPLERKER